MGAEIKATATNIHFTAVLGIFVIGALLVAPLGAQDEPEDRVREHMAMYNKGFVEEAVAGLQAEKTAHPEEIEPSFYLGYIYGKLRMYRVAAREFRYCLEINPDLPEIHYNLGTVLNSQGDY
ncbi:MAG: tetratricopeptide repeat protein, partial [Candidatus Dadabacteria bacterium]|nr:tetratricopeptide repeat protein [Candidatus Dadabacteria bacterium]